MLIVCPTCATTYEIPLASLGAGRQVRCSSCKNAWFATAEREIEQVVAAPAPATAEAEQKTNLPVPVPVALSKNELEPEPVAEDFDVVIDQPAAEILPPEIRIETPTVIDAPPLVPHDLTEAPAAPKFEPGLPDPFATTAEPPAPQRYVARRPKRTIFQRLVSLPMAIVAMLAIVLGALNWRVGMVRHFPQTASLYAAIGLPVNLRGLFLQDVKSRSDFQDGITVLVIEGMIVNLTTHKHDVPRLRFALRNKSGQEVYAWTAQPPKPTLGSGNGLPFRARLASPPPDGADVIVRFLNRRDLVAGSQ